MENHQIEIKHQMNSSNTVPKEALDDIALISTKIKSYVENMDNIELRELVSLCKKLENILGYENETYVDVVSIFLKAFLMTRDIRTQRLKPLSVLLQGKELQMFIDGLREQVDEIHSVSSLKMPTSFIDNLVRAREELEKLLIRSEAKMKQSKSGCYIATMAYGYYDHPQVMLLRQFRDDVLNTSVLGKWFIKIYYHYSPKLVEKLQDNKQVNIFIRSILNQFIKIIK